MVNLKKDSSHPHNSIKAFTLIELLIVITLIVILMAMLFPAINYVQKRSLISKTYAILATVQTGLSLSGAKSGGIPQGAEHPMAGSKEPRPRFVRTAGYPQEFPRYDLVPPGLSATSAFKVNDIIYNTTTLNLMKVDTSGLAWVNILDVSLSPIAWPVMTNSVGESFSGIRLSEIDTASPLSGNLMLPSDMYADRRFPLLYGLRRDQIGLLSGGLRSVTRYRLLPHLTAFPDTTNDTNADGLLDGPYDTSRYPDSSYLMAPGLDLRFGSTTFGQYVAANDTASNGKNMLDYVFGASNSREELVRLGSIMSPPAGVPGIEEFKDGPPAGSPSPLGTDDYRLYQNTAKGNPMKWSSGSVFMSKLSDPGSAVPYSPGAGGSWAGYYIPSVTVFDAWGNEVLFNIDHTGSPHVMSAGPDGVFVWNPGPNGFLDTVDPRQLAPTALTDDRKDGERDNIAVGNMAVR